jgi:predicted dehydrogenase
MSTLRAAIIGTGRIGSRLEKDPLRARPCSHAGWYEAHPRTRLVAGADIDAAALAEFGRDWGLDSAHLYEDYTRMLREQRPDLVSVCGWAPDRLAMCRAAIEAGARGLWIEKPIACSLAEADALERLVVTAGVSAVVDHPRRADARYRAVRRIITARTGGALESVHAAFSGHWLHTGTHAWDILDYWCGEWAVATAFADATSSAGPADGRLAGSPAPRLPRVPACPDPGGAAHIVYANGTHVFVSGSRKEYFVFQFDLVLERARVLIGNEELRVFLPAPSPRYTGFVELEERSASEFVLPTDAYEFPMVHDLVHAVETGAAPLMSVRNAVEALGLGLALAQSAGQGGRGVRRAEVDRSLRIDTV